MNLFLIRHTQVDVETDICYGQTDVDVAATFSTESKKVANRITGIYFDKIYSSPLKRCRLLAENIFHEKEIIYNKKLMELNFGDWEMKTWDDIYFLPEGKVWMDNYHLFPTKNGESYPEMVKRIKEFYTELTREPKGNIAIITHAGVIRIFKSIIENKPIKELFSTFKPEYGSVLKLEV